MVMPPLTALFADTALKRVCDMSPFLRTFILNKHQNFFVFLLCPRSFDQTRVEDFLPAMETLNVSAAGKVLSDLLPVLLVIARDSISQEDVLFLSPVTFS